MSILSSLLAIPIMLIQWLVGLAIMKYAVTKVLKKKVTWGQVFRIWLWTVVAGIVVTIVLALIAGISLIALLGTFTATVI